MSDPIHYIVVRKDLPFGTTLAMVGHAASAADYTICSSPATIVVLGVDTEDDLERLSDYLSQFAVSHVRITESMSPWNGQLMSLGTPIGERSVLSKHFAHLKVYKGS